MLPNVKRIYRPYSRGRLHKRKTITEEEFWELLNRAKTKGEDQEEQIEWLTSHLAKRTVHEIVAFDTHMHRLLKESYTSRLWA